MVTVALNPRIAQCAVQALLKEPGGMPQSEEGVVLLDQLHLVSCIKAIVATTTAPSDMQILADYCLHPLVQGEQNISYRSPHDDPPYALL